MYVVMSMCEHECSHVSTCVCMCVCVYTHVVLYVQAYRHTRVTRHVHRHTNVLVCGMLDMCEHELMFWSESICPTCLVNMVVLVSVATL